jgi:hypothetical protein
MSFFNLRYMLAYFFRLNANENTPFIKTSKLDLLLVIPLGASLEIVLETQPAADGTATRQVLGNVFPFQTIATKLNDGSILLMAPFRLLLLGWRLRRTGSRGRQSLVDRAIGNVSVDRWWGQPLILSGDERKLTEASLLMVRRQLRVEVL